MLRNHIAHKWQLYKKSLLAARELCIVACFETRVLQIGCYYQGRGHGAWHHVYHVVVEGRRCVGRGDADQAMENSSQSDGNYYLLAGHLVIWKKKKKVEPNRKGASSPTYWTAGAHASPTIVWGCRKETAAWVMFPPTPNFNAAWELTPFEEICQHSKTE